MWSKILFILQVIIILIYVKPFLAQYVLPKQMEKLAQINERQIFYLWIKEHPNWPQKLPTSNWLVVPIGHDLVKETINKSAVECLKREVSYVCAIGKVCEQIHDMFDEEIVWQKIQNGESIENEEDFVREPMTTWHNDFNEGVWFAITSAYDGYTKIKFIMCLDLTENGEKDQLIRILNLIQAGWLPK